MTSTALTPRWSSNKLVAAWQQLVGLLTLALLVGACSQGPTEIGIGLPDANANTGAYLVDTLTVRASTVLRDSVVTSSSPYLLVGQYQDPLFGKLTARSFFRLGGSFAPESNYVADSAVLLLTAQANQYSYGDTTQAQALFNVYQMDVPLPTNKPLFSSQKLTDLRTYYTATAAKQLNAPLGASGQPQAVRRRVRPNAYTIRVRLTPDLANRLMVAGKAGQLLTTDQLQTLLPGLVVTPAAADNGALVRLDATSTTSGLALYYHDPANAATALNTTFTIANGSARCFQIEADRSATITRNLTTQSLKGNDASETGYQTFIEGTVGYETRLEIPYLNDLTRLGRNITITSAQFTAEVPTATLTPYVPTPPSLLVQTSNAINQPIGTYLSSVSYTSGISPTTALDQGSYTIPVTSYVQAVLAHTVSNNGFLLSTTTPTLPSRLVLGSSRNQLNRLRLRVYVISTN